MLQLRAVDELSAERAAGSVAEHLQVDFLKLQNCMFKVEGLSFLLCVPPSDGVLDFRSGVSDRPASQQGPGSDFRASFSHGGYLKE